MSGRSFNYGPHEATDPRCCATCRFAVLRSGRGGALHHQCVVRGASLPTRERLRTVGWTLVAATVLSGALLAAFA